MRLVETVELSSVTCVHKAGIKNQCIVINHYENENPTTCISKIDHQMSYKCMGVSDFDDQNAWLCVRFQLHAFKYCRLNLSDVSIKMFSPLGASTSWKIRHPPECVCNIWNTNARPDICYHRAGGGEEDRKKASFVNSCGHLHSFTWKRNWD